MSGSLRILGGRFKGKILHSPKTSEVRPTSSIVRKALFDICRPIIDEASFLDLFAGSGAVGLEALSQGAHAVTFVEKSSSALRTLQQNISSLPLSPEQAALLKMEAFSALNHLEKQGKSFSLIYLDPPYRLAQTLLPKILLKLDTSPLLLPQGELFIEEQEDTPLLIEEIPLHHLHLISKRRFGMTQLLQFAKSS